MKHRITGLSFVVGMAAFCAIGCADQSADLTAAELKLKENQRNIDALLRLIDERSKSASASPTKGGAAPESTDAILDRLTAMDSVMTSFREQIAGLSGQIAASEAVISQAQQGEAPANGGNGAPTDPQKARDEAMAALAKPFNPNADAEEFTKFKEMMKRAEDELNKRRWHGAIGFAMAVEHDRKVARNVRMGVDTDTAKEIHQLEVAYSQKVNTVMAAAKKGEMSPDQAKAALDEEARQVNYRLRDMLTPEQKTVYDDDGGIEAASHHTKNQKKK